MTGTLSCSRVLFAAGIVMVAAVVTAKECFDDSQCKSDRCLGHVPPDVPGVCQCNSVTQVGCNEGETCTDSQLASGGPPLCTRCGDPRDDCMAYWEFCHHLELQGCSDVVVFTDSCPYTFVCGDDAPDEPLGLEIGSECFENWECESLRCHYGEQTMNTPGTCQCNSETNAGCNHDETCTDVETRFDGLPLCTVCGDPSDDCMNSTNWQQCHELEVAGCANIEKGESCPFQFSCEKPKLIGEDCLEDIECDSDRCFFGFQPVDQPGKCQCNSENNAGCDDGETCTDVAIAFDGLPMCTKCGDPEGRCMENWQDCRDHELSGCNQILWLRTSCPVIFECADEGVLELGDECAVDFECQSGKCSGGTGPIGGQRVCVCDAESNAGCSESEVCVLVLALGGDAQPTCALDLGAACDSSGPACASNFCFNGVCQCHPILDIGCPDSQKCIGDDTVGYTCEADPDLLLPIGAPCDYDGSVCETGRCFFTYHSTEGQCSCDTETHIGCPEGHECVIDIVNDGPPFCALPEGSPCEVEGQADCSEETCCVSGICLNGSCAAAPVLTIGSSCRVNADCDTGYCYHGFKPPDTPGECRCNPSTHSGCTDGRFCTISSRIADIPPFCGLPLGSLCDSGEHFDCASENCFEGTCQCTVFFNTGCLSTERCVGDDTTGYHCEGPGGTVVSPVKPEPEEAAPTPLVQLATDPQQDSSMAPQSRRHLLLGCALVLSCLLFLT